MNFLFFSFSALAVISCLLVIFSVHPVHSILSLILVFCLCSMLLLLITVDFFAFLLVIVYVGAIAVLFLFVIMMLNIKITQITESIARWIPLVLVLAFVVIVEIVYTVGSVIKRESTGFLTPYAWETILFSGGNIKSVGELLYSYYSFALVVSGVTLLAALIGAIVLTVGISKGSRRQEVYKQVGRRDFGSITFYK